MTPTELSEIIKQLGLSTTEAAQLLGVHARSMERYLKGDRAIHPTVGRFLRLLLLTGITPTRAFYLLDSI